MYKQDDLWGNIIDDQWIIFHDESICNDENFLYHGFLFISKKEGQKMLEQLFHISMLEEKYEKEIHFTKITGAGTHKAQIALNWISLSKAWLSGSCFKFYVLGIDMGKINQKLYSAFHKDKVYVRFYEIGLKSAIQWFQISSAKIAHLLYDAGKKDVERYNKSISILSDSTRVSPLNSDYLTSKKAASKFLQLTDVLLGTTRKSFTPISKNAEGQKKCVDEFSDIITRFNKKSAFNPKSRYWKKFGMSFYPLHSSITPDEFNNRDLEYHRKANSLFYNNRPTYNEKKAKKDQGKLF